MSPYVHLFTTMLLLGLDAVTGRTYNNFLRKMISSFALIRGAIYHSLSIMWLPLMASYA